MHRRLKLVGVFLSISISYFMLTTGTLGLRASRDEVAPALDIHTLLAEGSLTTYFYYSNGGAYQVGMTQILRLSGLEYTATNLLSPFVGALVLSSLFVICYLVVGRHITTWWHPVVFAPVFFVFGGFLFRLLQTSHKGYTFTMVFVGIYTVNRLMSRRDRTTGFGVVLGLSLLGLSLTNYIWGAVYGIALAFPLLFSRRTLRQYGPGVAIPVLASGVATRLPIVRHNFNYFERTVIGPLLSRGSSNSEGGRSAADTPTPTSQTSTPSQSPTSTPDGATATPSSNGADSAGQTPSATPESTAPNAGVSDPPRPSLFSPEQTTALERIGDWPAVPGTGVSTWFVYVFGIFAVAGFSALAGVISLLQLSRRDIPPVGLQFLLMSSGLGVAAVGLFFAGDYATFKRIIVVPGVLGTLVWVISLASPRLPSPFGWLEAHRNELLAVTFAVLLVSSFLAIPRATLDGNGTPYDDYADDAQIEKIGWLTANAGECLSTHQSLDWEVAARAFGERLKPTTYDPTSSTVYDSGGPRIVTCETTAG